MIGTLAFSAALAIKAIVHAPGRVLDTARRRIRAVIRWVRLPWDLAVMAFWWWRARRLRDSKWVDTTGTL